jgi:iron complex transport system ATP-binding protein
MVTMAHKPFLGAKNVTVMRGTRPVLDACHLTLKQGELTVLIGPNGAGKTTLLKALCGLLPLAAGEIALDGQPLSKVSLKIRSQKMAYLEQRAQIAWPLSVEEVIRLGRMPHGDAMSVADQTIMNDVMTRLDIVDNAKRSVMALSGGEQARVLLARALAVQAQALLVDEPVASLDPKYQLNMMTLLRDEAICGTCVLAVMHDLTLAARFAHRLIVMDQGRIVADGLPADVLAEMGVSSVFGVQINTYNTHDGLHVSVGRH